MVSLAAFTGPTSATILSLPSVYTGSTPALRKLASVVLENAVQADVPGAVRLDLTKSVSEDRTAMVARSPVEYTIADNYRIQNGAISITGSLSANPLGRLGSGLSGSFGSVVRRDLRQLDELYRIQDLREPVALAWGKRFWPSLAMTIRAVHDGSHKVELSLVFEEIRIVPANAVAAVLDLDEVLAGAGGTEQLGSQPTSVVPEPSGVAGGVGG